MDYEKKYKEALVNMQELYNSMKYMSSTDALHTTTALERAFPELKESEDEKIRKEIINYFKVGDWVTFYGDKPFKILKVEQEQNGILDYLLLSQNGHDSYYNKKYVDENARLWTIQDAKDGDVLQLGKVTAIFKEFIGSESCSCYCSVCKGEFEIPTDDGFDNAYGCYDTHPATKEQRDFLFQKMKEAGYEWDTEKKEPKKIEQKPAWSEEDEEMLDRVQPKWKPSSQHIAALEYQVNSTCKGSWQYSLPRQ